MQILNTKKHAEKKREKTAKITGRKTTKKLIKRFHISISYVGKKFLRIEPKQRPNEKKTKSNFKKVKKTTFKN